MEHEAMLAMEMAPGYHALMQFLETAKVPKAILTHNNMDPVDHLLQHHASGYKFEPVVTRDTVRPTKPFPDPLEYIARLTSPRPILMVGDGTDDVKCAQAAGAMACYVHTIENGAHHALVDPDTRIEHLDELRALLRLVAADE
ncbi:HAD hydrolase, family IA [Allomyces macrogynus ATCC 38327]|uniref:HAD hydrolase, family IA n=1 Tax=Allomyces macrogynus (strain ATCC 38327) TaxID=578462 RepID=A0A0L0SI23_ALLM3|nr:HAD hydrolase, family IA [Allomyces macrogynus ATCC 38327]|eukprot:KNE62161.1 HAD hydrolase, family IA [Allomyces macrogynus ATCC 38327]